MLGFHVKAQLPVSTQPENRHVVLEEFTGIYCGQCPDGTRIVDEIKAEYPNTFHPILVHWPAFGAPGFPDVPDMNTDEGAKIINSGKPLGAPSAGLNRGTVSWGETSRFNWKADVKKLLDLPSLVNLALEAKVDMVAREMEVEVQVYYTNSVATQSQLLSVALLQDNILAPQSGADFYYPSKLKCPGKYVHGKLFDNI